ncbi:MAG: exonuclease SbcCD subunit D C-terminal domain-containing protein [Magnetococcales bacterium]|nr:exonuclease SbcCD subunit D C-terminal domain-containing protein [Magnetococcales bacterium]
MKICHTSDWHLGHLLCGQRRHEEFAAFLEWMVATIQHEQVDALLIAGDLFDTATPGHRAQALYYRFLSAVARSSCRHVVVIGGNHDSPSFLDAPKSLLSALHVHVVGAITDHPADEVLVLKSPEGVPELLVCAVPYLRDRDIRLSEAAESLEDKDRKLVEGIRHHYDTVISLALRQRREWGEEIPLVVMGHLFASGGRVNDGDGMRELYVGSLAQVSSGIFPQEVDYLALGHLHLAQKLGGEETRRYSGSPLPLGFGEAGRPKSVCLVTFQGRAAEVALFPVPVFRRLERIRGDREAILERIRTLVQEGTQGEPERVWIEVVHTGAELIGDLRQRLTEWVAGSGLEIVRIKDERLSGRGVAGGADREGERVEELDAEAVFERCLVVRGVPEEQCAGLRLAYREIVAALHDEDPHAP